MELDDDFKAILNETCDEIGRSPLSSHAVLDGVTNTGGIMKARNRCIIFLEQNGWRCDIDTPTEGYTCYIKNRCVGVYFNNNEMVFISDNGDFIHELINYYTLVGVLLEYRQIDCDYTSVSKG